MELRGSGVDVVCVCPGYIDTPMTRVNRFRMPFLLPADEAARRIARAIAARRRLAVVPWQMAAASILLRGVPGGSTTGSRRERRASQGTWCFRRL